MPTREQRLCVAARRAITELAAATSSRDEQQMFEALGHCLTWVCAIDELNEDQGRGYKSRRNTDLKGKVLRGLRYARNQLVHGVNIVDLADPQDVSTARLVIAGAASRGGSQIIMPASRLVWTFKPTLPPPTKAQPDLQSAYASDVANAEVMEPVEAAMGWPEGFCPQ